MQYFFDFTNSVMEQVPTLGRGRGRGASGSDQEGITTTSSSTSEKRSTTDGNGKIYELCRKTR